MRFNRSVPWVLITTALSFVPVMQSADAQDDITDDEVWLVDGIGGDDMNTGKGSWANARETIQSVLTDGDLEPGDRIWVRATTYTLTSTTDTYLLTDGVWLLGGFAGTETNRKQAKPYINETILDGDNVAYHVVTAIELAEDDPETVTRLDGFIIRNGDATGDSAHPRGGGLIMRNADEDPESNNFYLKVSRCRFQDNVASRGGAVAVYRPMNNMVAASHNLELTNCEFSGNSAINGGAIWVWGARALINNSLFFANTATSKGGAILLASSCDWSFVDCDTHSHCLVFSQQTHVDVNCCTITGNEANNGSGGGEAGGIYAFFHMTLDVVGSIIWGNVDGSNATNTEQAQISREHFCELELVDTADYSYIEDLDIYAGSGNIGNLELSPDFVNPSQNNYRLKSSSPCIDAGAFGIDFPIDVLDFNNDSNTTEPTPDLDQLRRVRNCVVDMGCYEHECDCEADLVSSLNFQPPGDGAVNAADLAFLLGEWGNGVTSLADMVTSATFQPPPDGNVDAADLAYLLGSWGTCPEECNCEQELMGGSSAMNPFENTEVGDLLDQLLEEKDPETQSALIEDLLELLAP